MFNLNLASPSKLLITNWNRVKNIPCGNYLFSKIVGKLIPYTGSISPLVMTIESGRAVVKLKDHRKIRNHLKSIHAIALANLGEFTTGLSLMSQLDENASAILVNIETTYLKKARGTLTAEANSPMPNLTERDTKHPIRAVIKNEQGDVVCEVCATWQVRKH